MNAFRSIVVALFLSSAEGAKVDLEQRITSNPFHIKVEKHNHTGFSQVHSKSQIYWSVKNLVNKAKDYQHKAEELDQKIKEKTGVDLGGIAEHAVQSSTAAQKAIGEAQKLKRQAEAK